MGQFRNFRKDIGRMVNGKNYRLLYIWMGRTFLALAVYRFERGAYLMFGKAYSAARIIFTPIFNILQSFTNVDIHYKADIGGGIAILHGSVGIVISGRAIIGENLSLVGGNVIGIKGHCPPGSFRIGNNVSLGANACIIGPVILGDRITVGALSCVVKDCRDGHVTLVGSPARAVVKSGS